MYISKLNDVKKFSLQFLNLKIFKKCFDFVSVKKNTTQLFFSLEKKSLGKRKEQKWKYR